jgi:membrane-associated phospholipid phosphatase
MLLTMGFRAVNSFAKHTAWLHGPARLFAEYGVVLFGLLLVAGLLLNRGRELRSLARSIVAGVGVLVAVAANQPIVHAVGERRPYVRWHDVLVLVHRSTDASFPSDHAVMAGAVAVGLLMSRPRLGAVAAVLALLMAADRVYVGAHYPGDVIAGLAFGGAVAALLQLVLSPTLTGVLERFSHGPLRPVLVGASRPRN